MRRIFYAEKNVVKKKKKKKENAKALKRLV